MFDWDLRARLSFAIKFEIENAAFQPWSELDVSD